MATLPKVPFITSISQLAPLRHCRHLLVLLLMLQAAGGGHRGEPGCHQQPPGPRPKTTDQLNTMDKILILILAAAAAGVCEASWPSDGLHYCDEIVHAETSQNCTACFNAAVEDSADTSLTVNCMEQYMPPVIARCAKFLNNDKKKFNKCVQNAARSQSDIDQRTRHLYKKAGAMLDVVLNADHVPHGPQALLSCMAQNILLYEPELETTLRDVASECWDRFEMDEKNAEWHLHSGKPWRSPTRVENQRSAGELTFDYGSMGHDMPFHGVGPLAVDYLKGECVIRDMAEHDRAQSGNSLQNLVDTILKYDAPVPAWLFREMMNNIDLISLA